MRKDSPFHIMFSEKYNPYFWISLLALFLYPQTIYFDYIGLDDSTLIVANYPFIKEFSHILDAFRHDVFYVPGDSGVEAYYRPILTLTFMLESHIGGISPRFYHLMDIFYHTSAAILLFKFLTRLRCKKDPAFLLTVLFTVHPIATSVVSWITCRNESLLAIFILLSFIWLIDFIEQNSKIALLCHILFFTIALFTKETALAFVPLFLMFIYLFKWESTPGSLNPSYFKKAVLTFSLLVVIVSWFTIRQRVLHNPDMTVIYIIKSIFRNLPAIIPYLGKVLLPVNLSVYPTMADTKFVYGFITLALTVAGVFLSKGKRPLFVLFGVVWFLLSLIPSLVRMHSGADADHFMEHRLYLPLIGFLIIAIEVDIIKYFSFNNAKVVLTCGLIVVVFFAITFVHARCYRNGIIFYRSAVATSPHAAFLRVELAKEYFALGKNNLAEEELIKAVTLNPSVEGLQIDPGIGYGAGNQVKFVRFQTIKFYKMVASAYAKVNNNNSAFSYYIKALVEDPGNVETLKDLGDFLMSVGRDNDAVKVFDKELYLKPNNREYLINKGKALQNLGKCDEAVRCFKDALLSGPILKGMLNKSCRASLF
ncbi:MAG: hypothetical protein HQK96_15945 [Nitrospirae bacterium]|nr:hypothetical protein [Nitrospirota bacterium]